MCFDLDLIQVSSSGLDLIEVSSSDEEPKKLSALAGDFGFWIELARRLFGLLLVGMDSVFEEDPSIFVNTRISSISAQCSRCQR